ncbi:MarR family winged helix-turn-helix transcriptional regulator [Pedobacter agri]|uniref:MarR family winged helix-turn-helix transcriptional regulator n=1 Tax=Pedobacter agri TaxID=454586 RepID=UPI00277EB3EB|nr:MarR family transcriptional regulator [Pedobacter agri]MDQ1141811.1 DNA-binding MarR family transcriptional regulator [Pedobacter agri]
MDTYFKLEDQLCFPLYAASRMVTKCYQPVLDDLGITYPQYIVLMVLWETDNISMSFLADKLRLQSNTLTPLLKRMQEQGLVERIRSEKDERSIIVSLAKKGIDLKQQAHRLHSRIKENLGITAQEAHDLKNLLNKLILNISS